MKYNAEVDSEKRNKSPRNDLLRNRRCVGIIIPAARKTTHTETKHTRARFRVIFNTNDVFLGQFKRIQDAPKESLKPGPRTALRLSRVEVAGLR